jgi:hypothetical protein
MIDNFKQIGRFTFKCTKCGEEVPSGIITISEHWCKCTGKDFYTALMKMAKEGKIPTLKDIEQLQNTYLK